MVAYLTQCLLYAVLLLSNFKNPSQADCPVESLFPLQDELNLQIISEDNFSVMYKIPQNLDPQIFIGKTISQICYTTNLISLLWDDGGLHIMGSFSVYNNGNIQTFGEIFPVENDCQLLILLEKRVVSSIIPDTRDRLILSFEDEITLTLHSDKKYESFEIDLPGLRIIV